MRQAAAAAPASAQSLTIVENRAPTRPGGCAGIFVQLLEWNRRLAKKRLFSRKLLPSVRAAKWVSRKLGGDDKMPRSKLLLIAEENRKGLPNANGMAEPSGEGRGMCAPGLVARLMGLESMPVVHEKPGKASETESYCEKGGSSACERNVSLEFGRMGELRPQKLRKTEGFLESRPVSAARVGSNVLSKGLMSRSRKQNNKFVSPVKSPRVAQRRSSARLMEVATKILDPGLQSRNRAKYAITYVEDSEPAFFLKEPVKDVFVGSCNSCGSLVEIGELGFNAKETSETDHSSPVSELTDAPPAHNEFEVSNMRPPAFTQSHDRIVTLAFEAKMNNVQSRPCNYNVRKCDVQNDQVHCKSRQNVSSNSALRSNKLRQDQLQIIHDKVGTGSKLSRQQQRRRGANEFHKEKDFVAVNRNLISSTHTRSPTMQRGGRSLEVERNGCKQNTARKRRPISSPHIENVAVAASSFVKEKSRSKPYNQKGIGCTSKRSTSGNSGKTDTRNKAEGDSAGSSKGLVSKPSRRDPQSIINKAIEDKSSVQVELTRDVSNVKKSVMDPTTKGLTSIGLTLAGEALSSLLDQKVRELTSLDHQYESATGDPSQERYSASILEELITDIKIGASISQKNVDSCYALSSPTNESDCSFLHSQMCSFDKKYHEEARLDKINAFPVIESEHPSPISILEVSFSNNSSFSETLDVSSGYVPYSGLKESSCNPTDLENDLLDSATSLFDMKFTTDRDPYLINENSSKKDNILSETLACTFNSDVSICNAKILLQNIALDESDNTTESSAELFLLDLLETIIGSFLIGSNESLGFIPIKKGSQIWRLLFDCMIECFDSKYSLLCQSGYKSWLKLTHLLSRNWLRREVHEEIRWWRDLAGIDLDDLIEKEHSHSTSKWEDSEIELFEMGIQIESAILHVLINEMVLDLC